MTPEVEGDGDAILRILKITDIPAALELSAQAGWNQTADDWGTLIELAPQSCLAIEIDCEIAATTTLLCFGHRLAWVGMVLTKAAYRGRGFAKRLLTHALHYADGMGIETVKLDATDQGRPLYEKMGFRIEQTVERWRRPASASTPRTALPSPELSGDDWRMADRRAVEVNRSELLDRLSRFGPPLQGPTSFLFTRPGRCGTYLGPCVCSEETGARNLIESAVEARPSRDWYWDLLPKNTGAVSIAQSLGFTPSRHLLRMVRGKDLPAKEELIYAIAGFELG
jgi:GNAT superfamily N-acetyltransferase